jgi:RNA polymerase subunit RPABC4/transcription elongation factor Spt4
MNFCPDCEMIIDTENATCPYCETELQHLCERQGDHNDVS